MIRSLIYRKQYLIKNISICVLATFVFIVEGCSVIYIPKFESSNQMFIEQTVDKLNLGGVVKKVIPVGSRVALVSMELNTTGDRPFFAAIEDQLIQSLYSEGFIPLERDENLLGRLVAENKGTAYTVIRLPLRDSVDQKTSLMSAPFIVTYRVLECGLIYRDLPGDKQQSLRSREGLVKLHIRIEKCSTGEIIYARNATGYFTDKIRVELVGDLKDFHYAYFPYDYPVQPK